MKRMLLAAVLTVVMAGPAFAHECPRHMAAIDAALAKNPTLAADVMNNVKKWRADGETYHKAGKHTESLAELAKAEKALGIQ